MHGTVCPHKLQQKLSSLFARGGPWPSTFGGHTRVRTGMHQRLYRSCEKAIYDKEILFDAESWVQAFEIAGVIIINAMTQYQVLSASWRTDWVSLNKAESLESTFQRHGLEKTSGDGKPAQIIQRNQHDSKLAEIYTAKVCLSVAALKYPQVQRSRIGDKGICFQESPRE
jgi:hypothetical protein